VRQQEDGEGHQWVQRPHGPECAAGAALRVLRVEGLLPDGVSRRRRPGAEVGGKTVNEALLKTCNACGNKISRHSPFCRHCGHPQPLPVFLWLVIAFLLILIAFYLSVTIYGALHTAQFQVSALWRALRA
jgi:hypothetical protein